MMVHTLCTGCVLVCLILEYGTHFVYVVCTCLPHPTHKPNTMEAIEKAIRKAEANIKQAFIEARPYSLTTDRIFVSIPDEAKPYVVKLLTSEAYLPGYIGRFNGSFTFELTPETTPTKESVGFDFYQARVERTRDPLKFAKQDAYENYKTILTEVETQQRCVTSKLSVFFNSKYLAEMIDYFIPIAEQDGVELSVESCFKTIQECKGKIVQILAERQGQSKYIPGSFNMTLTTKKQDEIVGAYLEQRKKRVRQE
jgi:hypothetical protein